MTSLGPTAAAGTGRDRSSGLLVVGMHRSGTSLATSLSAAFGFTAAGELMPPLDDNPRGFWEHLGIENTHEEFLHRLGRTWVDPTPLPADAFRGDDADWARNELSGHLERDLLPQSRWVLKDPRLCRLLPLWKPLLEREDLDVRYLLVLRSPAAVVGSLAHRNGLPPHHSLLLWLGHCLEAERQTRDRHRHWFDFDRFTHSPEEVTDELVAWLEADGESPATASKELLDSIYDPDLVHHLADAGDEITAMSAEPWVAETYAALAHIAATKAESPSALAALDAVYAELTRAGEFLDRPVERERLEKERDGARRELGEVRGKAERLQGQLDAQRQRTLEVEAALDQVFSSRSWRWTRPLRREKR